MRWLLLTLLIPAAFLLGRATSPGTASAQSASHIFTLQQNDVVRAPGAATRCTASAEGGAKNLFCHRSPEGRYQVVFYSDSIIVWRNGNPDKPAFSARWQR